MIRAAVACALASLLVVLHAPSALATSWQAALLAPDRANADFLGESVDIAGDTVVVGARLNDAGGFNRGAAYVFVRTGSTWSFQAKLMASDAANSDSFGASVSVSGDTIVVGAPGDDDAGTSSGSAYVFERSAGAWSQTAKLFAPGAAAGDEFGTAVSVSNDTAVIGAFRDDDGATDTGSASVFREVGSSWTHEAKLVAPDRQAGDLFGQSVAISGDNVLIGAYADDDRALDAGSAYVFRRDEDMWAQAVKVVAPDGASADSFGFSVSISDETGLVGAFGHDGSARNAGAAYVLQPDGAAWRIESKLQAPNPTADTFFGRAVSVDGGAAVIGAAHEDDVFRDAGAAYVFERRGGIWIGTDKLTAPAPAATDLLGYAVDIDGDTGVVGVPLDDDRGIDTGSAHVFTGLADVEPPTITAEVRPLANEAGWHRTVPVEVEFSCSDAGSGVASCTSPVTLTSEPGATVTGTAVDQVGHSTSRDVEVRIDMTSPLLTIDNPSPIPGLVFPASSLQGTVEDALSGVDTVEVTFTNLLTGEEQARTATIEGTTWNVAATGLDPGPTVVAATALDVAGNTADAAVLFIASP